METCFSRPAELKMTSQGLNTKQEKRPRCEAFDLQNTFSFEVRHTTAPSCGNGNLFYFVDSQQVHLPPGSCLFPCVSTSLSIQHLGAKYPIYNMFCISWGYSLVRMVINRTLSCCSIQCYIWRQDQWTYKQLPAQNIHLLVFIDGCHVSSPRHHCPSGWQNEGVAPHMKLVLLWLSSEATDPFCFAQKGFLWLCAAWNLMLTTTCASDSRTDQNVLASPEYCTFPLHPTHLQGYHISPSPHLIHHCNHLCYRKPSQTNVSHWHSRVVSYWTEQQRLLLERCHVNLVTFFQGSFLARYTAGSGTVWQSKTQWRTTQKCLIWSESLSIE